MHYNVVIEGIGEDLIEPSKGDGSTINFDAGGDTTVDSIVRRGVRSIFAALEAYGKKPSSAYIIRSLEDGSLVSDNLITGIREIEPGLNEYIENGGQIGDTEEFRGEDFPSA